MGIHGAWTGAAHNSESGSMIGGLLTHSKNPAEHHDDEPLVPLALELANDPNTSQPRGGG